MGNNIRAARSEAGLTQAQLGARLGTGETNVSRWERGKVMPGLDNLVALAAELGCEPGWFYVDRDAA